MGRCRKGSCSKHRCSEGRTAQGSSAEGSVGLGGRRSERGLCSSQGEQRTQGSGLEVAWKRYVGPDAKSAYSSPFKPNDHPRHPGGNIPSSLLPLPTDISSPGPSSPKRPGLWAVHWQGRRLVFLTLPPIPFLVDIGNKAGSQNRTKMSSCG